MTTHSRFEQIIARAIDFSLTPAEQAGIADHLATCSTCRAMAAGYRSDASALRSMAFAEPPARVRSAVLVAAARPAARMIEPWKLLAAAALLLAALTGAAAAVGAWNTRPALVVVVPSASPSSQPNATPAPSPSAVEPSAEPTPFAPPAATCPSPASAVRLPDVTVTVGGAPGIVATRWGSTTMTCTTTASGDAIPSSPTTVISASPADRLTLALPAGWAFLRLELTDGATSQAATTRPAVDTPDRPSRIEASVPARPGESIVGFDLWMVRDDGRVVGQLSGGVRVRVSSAAPAVLDPSTARWTKLGVVPASGALVAFDGGYALLAPGDSLTSSVVRFSADGKGWATASLSSLVPNCPGQGPQVSEAIAGAIAANGRELVVVGEEQLHDVASCANVAASVRPVAWHSSDGRTWRRSAPFEVGGDNARATAVWATPSGWQAAVVGGGTTIWESSDGLTWHQVNDPTATFTGKVAAAGAAPDGTVVMSTLSDAASGPGLFTSRDGLTWGPIKVAGGCEAAPGTTQIVGPTAQGLDAWVVLDDMRLCTSRDLVSWSGTTMTAAPFVVAQTRFGAIVLGDACHGAGSTCAPDPSAYVTADGVTWTPLPHPPVYWGRTLADGPAGVLMIGQGTANSGATTVWSLDP